MSSEAASHRQPNQLDTRKECVRVAIRVRPLNERERSASASPAWRVSGGNTIERVTGQDRFTFDHVFDEQQTTEEVYRGVAASVVQASMQGINGTVFAYGQTSSGKTHTMMGSREYPGVIPFALSDIFQYIKANVDREFRLRVSHLEIYNEEIRDLLMPENRNLKVQDNLDGTVKVARLSETDVRSPADIMSLIVQGQAHRQTAATNMNEESSRSHSIFRLIIESRCRQIDGQEPDEVDGGVQIADLNLVDLAGSERASSAGSSGARLKEGGHINKSLLTLGQCIRFLSEGDNRHIPFRDSKLTRILSSALGGNSVTVIICAVTPASLHIDETVSTIKFASRARSIQNVVKKNEIVDEQTQIRRLMKEVASLKSRLRRSDESDELRLLCESKTRALVEAQSQAAAFRKLFIHGNTLDSTRAVLPDCRSRNRRQTVDPAAFMAELQRNPPQHRPSFNPNESCPGNIELKTDSNRPSTDVGHQLEQQLRREKQQIADRCARAESEILLVQNEAKNARKQCEQQLEQMQQERKTAADAQAELERRIGAMTIEAATMAANLETMKKEGAEKEISHRSLETAISDLRCSSEEANAERDRRIREMERSHQVELHRRIDQLDTLSAVQHDLHDEIERLKETSSSLTDSLGLVKAERDDLQNQLTIAANDQQVAELQEQIVRLHDEKASLAETAKDAQAKFTQMANLTGSKQEQFLRAQGDRALVKAERHAEKLLAKVQALEQAARGASRDAIDCKNQRAALDRTVKSLERQVAAREKELATSRTLTANTNALQKQVRAGQEAEDAAKAALHTSERDRHRLEEQARVTEAQLEHCESSLVALRQSKAAVDHDTERLGREISELGGVIEQHRSENNALKETIDTLKAELSCSREKLASTEALRDEAEENAVQAHFRLEGSSLEFTDALSAQTRSNSELSATIASLRVQLDEACAERQVLSVSLQSERTARETLSSSNSMQSAEVDRLRALFDGSEEELLRIRTQLLTTTDELKTQTAIGQTAQARFNHLQQETVELRSRISESSAECSRLDDALESALSSHRDAAHRESSLANRLASVQAKLQTVQSENEQLNEELVRFGRAPSANTIEADLRVEVEQLKATIVAKSTEIDQLNMSIPKKVAELMKAFRKYAAAAAAKERDNRPKQHNLQDDSSVQ